MPEESLNRKFYKIKLNGMIFYYQFETKEQAKKFALLWLSKQKEEASCEIYLIKETPELIEELKNE